MIFLLPIDLDTQLKPYLNQGDASLKSYTDNIERQNIAFIKSKLGGRFDADEIFAQTGDERNAIIIKILSVLVAYDLIRRNAARKVPDDYKEERKWAMTTLNELQAGTMAGGDLPKKSADSDVIYGNTKNSDYYL